MADFCNKVTAALHPSVNTADYESNPDMARQTRQQLRDANAIPQKYRKWDDTAGTLIEMTQPEKDQVDHDEQVAKNDAAESTISEDQLKAISMTTLDLVNQLRDEHSLPHYTWDQFRQRYRINLDTITGV